MLFFSSMRLRKFINWQGPSLLKPDRRNAAIVFIAFLALSSLSYADRHTALVVCAAGVVLLGTASAELIFALTLFLVPFSQYFAFNRHDVRILIAIALIICATRLFPRVAKYAYNNRIRGSTYVWIFSGFFILVILHFGTSNLLLEAQGAGLLVAAFMLFFSIRFLKDDFPTIPLLVEFALVTGAFTSVTLSALFLYVPFPHLVVAHLPVDNLRLTGVSGGPNATARYLLPVVGSFMSRALCDNRRRWFWVAFLVITCILLGATGSKAAIGGAVVMCFVALFLSSATMRFRTRFISSITVLSLLVCIFGLKPYVEYYAAKNWQANGNGQIHYYLETPPASVTAHQVVTRDLRVGISSKMTESPGGKIHYKDRPYSIWHTGQRDILWKGGVEVIRDNILWGIGYKAWQKEMEKRLGFPFESPHNAFLEVTGAYGLLGGALYIFMLVVFFKAILTMRRHPDIYSFRPFAWWSVLSCMGLFAVEVVDVSTSLAATLFVIWFWVLLGLQESCVADNPR